jgi:acyl-CoA thioester hydrolase
MPAADAAARDAYAHWLRIPTRWMDNDVYGHVNNVVYYSYFDTVINHFLIMHAGLDLHGAAPIGLCAESQCRYLAPLAFPQVVEAGLRVDRLGRSSVRYAVGLFAEGTAGASAEGWFVHVFVDRVQRRPVPIEGPMRDALQRLLIPAPGAGDAAC